MRSQYTRKSRWSSQLVSQPDCDFDVQRFRYAQETMVIIAFQKFGVKGRHKDFPFASPSAQNGSAWPDDCPKKKKKTRASKFWLCPTDAAEMLHHCMSYCLVHICAHRNLLVKSSIAWIRQWSKSELTLYYCIPMHFISWSTAIWGYVLWTYTADSARSSYFGGKDPSSNRSAINRRIVEYHSE